MSDRPLGRRMIRLAAMALGPARAHRQDLWPGLHLDGQLARWKGRPLLRLARFRDMLPPGPLAIVGSGPSLAGQPVESLDGRVLLLNGALRLVDRIPHTAAVVIEDERFVFRHGRDVLALPDRVPLMLSPAALRALAAMDATAISRRRVALIRNLRRPVGGRKRDLNDPALDPVLFRSGTAALSRDPEQGVVIMGTVALSALQIALAARPPGICLAGIDLQNADAPRFYETAQDRAPSGLVTGLERILSGFAAAKNLADLQGIKLTCASPVSSLLEIGYPYDPVLV